MGKRINIKQADEVDRRCIFTCREVRMSMWIYMCACNIEERERVRPRMMIVILKSRKWNESVIKAGLYQILSYIVLVPIYLMLNN
jgi:hypothetical protein